MDAAVQLADEADHIMGRARRNRRLMQTEDRRARQTVDIDPHIRGIPYSDLKGTVKIPERSASSERRRMASDQTDVAGLYGSMRAVTVLQHVRKLDNNLKRRIPRQRAAQNSVAETLPSDRW